MPRSRLEKPWFHQRSGYWCTFQRGKRVYLDRDFRAATSKLRQLRAQTRQQEQGLSLNLDAPFVELADEFLDDIKSRRAPATYDAYRYRLARALKVLGSHLRVGQIRKFHLTKIERSVGDSCSPTTVKDTIAVVQAVFHWAVANDFMDVNPLIGYQKPRARSRNRVMEPAEFQKLLKHTDASFRRILFALRFTGCRPKEVRTLIWEWVDLEQGFWILPDHKTINRQRDARPRMIPLPMMIWKLCRWLARQPHASDDVVFLNSRGCPYGKDSLCRKMARLRKRCGIDAKAGEDLVLYSNRHTFATETLGRVSDIELAELLGHTDVRTTRRYTHVNAARLRDIERRAHAVSPRRMPTD